MSARASAVVEPPWDLDAWRAQARAALLAGVAPADLDWQGDAQAGLAWGTPVSSMAVRRTAPVIPRTFFDLAAQVLCHRSPERHALLFRLAWRLAAGERRLLNAATDEDVHRAGQMAQAVRRDLHKMKAFVRFRAVPGEDNAFIAWFEPEHYILDRVAPFFSARFAGMRWAILTPDRSVAWDQERLAFGPGSTRSQAPAEDAQEALWRTYYASIFNPARLNPRMMRQEMPQKYWRHLPEAQALPELIRDAGARVQAMAARQAQPPRRRIVPAASQQPLPPRAGSMAALHAAIQACRACPLWVPATQAVAGEGPEQARVVFVGEQPGDEEDLQGRPFVGPAGRLLARALEQAGIVRSQVYLTNAVKHFHFERRGKRRLHQAPDPAHTQACGAWLAQELALLAPRLVVCLGATAARSVLGGGFALMRERGVWRDLGTGGTRAMATVHPAWVLRRPEAGREQAYALLLEDLREVRRAIDALA